MAAVLVQIGKEDAARAALEHSGHDREEAERDKDVGTDAREVTA